MIGRPAIRKWLHTVKPQPEQIKRVDEHIDRTNRIALFDPVTEAFRQQRRLPAIHPSNGALARPVSEADSRSGELATVTMSHHGRLL
jgi:hypothetical protein